MGLTQAEAVIDLIEAETADAAANAVGQVGGRLQKALQPIYQNLTDLCSHFHAVLDYPDEGCRGVVENIIYSGMPSVAKAIVGGCDGKRRKSDERSV